MTDTFKCAICHNEFEKGRSDEEAHAEMVSTFGEIPEDETVAVCDDCFKKVNPETHPVELAKYFQAIQLSCPECGSANVHPTTSADHRIVEYRCGNCGEYFTDYSEEESDEEDTHTG